MKFLQHIKTTLVTVVRSGVAVFILLACATSRPTTANSSVTPRLDSIIVETKKNIWTPRIMSGHWQYFIRDSSKVYLSNDTTTHVLPIESTMIYSITLVDSGNVLMLVSHIDSTAISTHATGKTSIDTSRSFEVISRQGQILFTQNQATCTTSSTAPAGRVNELIIALPAQARVGDRWADTASTTNCHGKIPLIQRAIREYELLDLNSCLEYDAIKVRRMVSDTFTGASTEANNHLSASGSGTGSSVLCLQRDTGMLLQGDGQSRLDLTVVTTRGTFPFTQNTVTHIERR